MELLIYVMDMTNHTVQKPVATLKKERHKNMKDKYNKSELFREIYPLINGRDVLDIGCIEHTVGAKINNPFWVHDFLKNNCNVLGIDILERDVKALCEEGYNMKVANAETFELGREFDAIFAGELIEHLSNPGLFLQQSKKHLKENGLLIITTPNTFYTPRLVGCIVKINDDPMVNIQHTNWFSPSTLKTLFEREGFNIVSIKRFDAAALKKTHTSRLKRSINKTLKKEVKGSLLVVAEVRTECKQEVKPCQNDSEVMVKP